MSGPSSPHTPSPARIVADDVNGPFNTPAKVRVMLNAAEYGLKSDVFSVGGTKRARGETWREYAELLEATTTDAAGLYPLTSQILRLEARVMQLKQQRRGLHATLRATSTQATEDIDELHEVVNEQFGEGFLDRLLLKKQKTKK